MSKITTDQVQLTKLCQDLTALEYDSVFKQLELQLELSRTGVGLSAPQIGIQKRAFVINYRGQKYHFANSEIVSGKYPEWGIEGCLSVPGREFKVRRNQRVVVKDDINGEQEYRGILARIIQHEHDHTMGITLVQSGEEIKIV